MCGGIKNRQTLILCFNAALITTPASINQQISLSFTPDSVIVRQLSYHSAAGGDGIVVLGAEFIDPASHLGFALDRVVSSPNSEFPIVKSKLNNSTSRFSLLTFNGTNLVPAGIGIQGVFYATLEFIQYENSKEKI